LDYGVEALGGGSAGKEMRSYTWGFEVGYCEAYFALPGVIVGGGVCFFVFFVFGVRGGRMCGDPFSSAYF